METTTVTSKGQVTIPKTIRQKLGIRKGTRIEFILVGDRVELRIQRPVPPIKESGFGLLKSRRPPVPADFDPARLADQEP